MGLSSKQARYFSFEVAFLAVLALGLGFLVIPSHWTSIWADWEFTGWVAPIANRMAAGQILYSDGGHFPVPPLSFVFVYLLSRGQATWLWESGLNYLFQWLALFTAYWSLSRHLPRPFAFLVIVGCVPTFLLLPKTLLYDSMAQFWVALIAGVAVYYLCPPLERGPVPWGWSRQRAAVLTGLGLLTAICILTKQSTGVGIWLGVMVGLGSFPRSQLWQNRLREIGTYALATLLSLPLLVLLISPFINPNGLLIDVFLTGSEPKGGSAQFLTNLLNYLVATQVREFTPDNFITILLKTGLTALIVGGLLGLIPCPGQPNPSKKSTSSFLQDSSPDFLPWFRVLQQHIPLIYLLTSSLALFMIVATIRVDYEFTALLDILIYEFWKISLQLILISIGTTIVFTLWGLLYRHRFQKADSIISAPLLAFSIITFPPAIFHNLSVDWLRLEYDNNIWLIAVIAILFHVTFSTIDAFFRLKTSRTYTSIVILCLVTLAIQFSLWARYTPHLSLTIKSTEPWPEIAFLTGAKLRPDSEGMRQVIKTARYLAPNPDTDAVLLLPNDPNVEAWFERPRPSLAGAIVFTDQYWDRYVDTDFERLVADPPKVIVIGPLNWWREFHRWWNVDTGAERLIDRVQNELIPGNYRLYQIQPIAFQFKRDYMEIYVRLESNEGLQR